LSRGATGGRDNIAAARRMAPAIIALGRAMQKI
jgi:hypothetical protein